MRKPRIAKMFKRKNITPDEKVSHIYKKYFFSFQVAEIQASSSRLEVQNSHLNSDLQQCERSRTEAAAEAAKQLQLKQKTHDDQVQYTCA